MYQTFWRQALPQRRVQWTVSIDKDTETCTSNIWSKQSKLQQFFSLSGNFTCFYSKKITKKTRVPRRSILWFYSRRCNKKLQWNHSKPLSIRIFISTVWWSSRFFKLTNSHILIISEVTVCIQFDNELHVKLFYKGYFVPLSQWFRPVKIAVFRDKACFKTSL